LGTDALSSSFLKGTTLNIAKRIFWISGVVSLVLSQISQEWFFLTATITHISGILILSERIRNPIIRGVCSILLLGFAPSTIGAMKGASEGIASVLQEGTGSTIYSYQRVCEEVYKMPLLVAKVVEERDTKPFSEATLPLLLLGVAGILLLAILLLYDLPKNIVLSLKERRYKSESRIE
jgi:phosphoglycerol transferase MdoB-like AlkP superfamily enzyme